VVSSVVDPNSFFSDSDSHPQIFISDSNSDPYTNILTRNVLKLCLSLLLYVLWNLYDREKSFPTEKLTFFLFQVFDLRLFTKNFILQQCLDPKPNFFSDSDPAKIFGFFRIRIHNTGGECGVYSFLF
jgi:hypothetical protein